MPCRGIDAFEQCVPGRYRLHHPRITCMLRCKTENRLRPLIQRDSGQIGVDQAVPTPARAYLLAGTLNGLVRIAQHQASPSIQQPFFRVLRVGGLQARVDLLRPDMPS